MNCPINEQTADGTVVGRCWYFLPDGKTCDRHGDVSVAVKKFIDTMEDGWEGQLTLESIHNPKLKKAIERNRGR